MFRWGFLIVPLFWRHQALNKYLTLHLETVNIISNFLKYLTHIFLMLLWNQETKGNVWLVEWKRKVLPKLADLQDGDAIHFKIYLSWTPTAPQHLRVGSNPFFLLAFSLCLCSISFVFSHCLDTFNTCVRWKPHWKLPVGKIRREGWRHI